MKQITVFTATFNRKELLKRVFDSLQKQTDQNFQWLIIDDGSNDKTDKYVNELKKQAKFDIRYFFKENGGKHTAYNLAVKKCETEYMLILDSDDVLNRDAIKILNSKLNSIKDEKFSGIIGNRFDLKTKRVIRK